MHSLLIICQNAKCALVHIDLFFQFLLLNKGPIVGPLVPSVLDFE